MTLEQFRKTLKITEEKTGKGDKLTEVWYIRDKDDPKGARGGQVTVLNKAAVEWTVVRLHASLLQHQYNQGSITLGEAQGFTEVAIRERQS